MSRLRYQNFLLLAPLAFLLLNFSLVFGSTLWAGNPVARVIWTLESANSNLTGVGLSRAVYGVVYERNVTGQRVHSSFALNTNSCASCHITHMAPGNRLIFQRSIYNACSTCHFDATMNGYNVLTGIMPGGAVAGGGRFFDGDFAEAGSRSGVSFHQATGSLEHWRAPGSPYTSTSPPPLGSPWLQPFTCASCHGPHGTFSGRHLHFNVNGQALRTGPVELVSVPGEVYLIPIFPYNNRTPWLFYDRNSPLFGTHGLRIFNSESPARDVTAEFRINHQLGRVWLERPSEAEPGPYRITFSQATVVDIEVQNAGSNQERTVYRGGVVNFCTACHTGYLQPITVDGNTYLYTRHKNFEHPIDSDITPFINNGFITRPPDAFPLEQQGGESQLVCLSCHFAHGTDAALMTRSNLIDPAYPEGSTSIPPETHLLRYGSEANDNREVCLACHNTMPATTLAVLSNSPLNQSTVSSPAELLIRFDRRVDMSTVIPGTTLRVFDTVYGTTVLGTVYATDNARTLVFTPQMPLPAGSYGVEVTTDVRSWFQRALSQLFSFFFNVSS